MTMSVERKRKADLCRRTAGVTRSTACGRLASVLVLYLSLSLADQAPGQTVSFSKSTLQGAGLSYPTSLQFGPDDRLYVSQQNGLIRIFDVVRNGPGDYAATSDETITLIRDIPNRNDDGTLNTDETDRQVTGLLVVGTTANPVIYVGSSDPRISVANDSGLDTNSGILSRLTWNGSSWDKLDLVRGLPRSEENHSTNGMHLDEATNVLYATQGGHTNMGAPSNSFSFTPEYALSTAILTIDLSAIGETTYDLPTLDDPTRPDTGPGGTDENDPFGGNNGDNQAMLVAGGPVQIHSPGWRNPYDLVVTQAGRMYTIDNGANSGWGGPPINEGPGGTCTNDVNEADSATDPDGLHYITGPGYYGGHPNPIRANTANTFNGQSPVPVSNPVECDYREPGVPLASGGDGALATWPHSTNGLCEYTASNFGGQMQGDLLTACWDGTVQRIQLNATGDAALNVETLFSNVANHPLDIIAQGNGYLFAGTIWVANHGSNTIAVFEPDDFVVCAGNYDAQLDEDGDGYTNADEIDNGTNPCSPGDVPADNDMDWVSDLNDPDDDNDGIPDTSDAFSIDPYNGQTTGIPFSYDWALGNPGTGFLGLGFTGLMANGATDYLDLFDEPQLTGGGAAGKFTIDAVSTGDALQSGNDQEYAFQLGVSVDATTGPFTVHTRVEAPYFDSQTPQDCQSMGLFIGTGDQDNYLKIVFGANGGVGGVEVVQEDGGLATTWDFADATLLASTFVDLYLSVEPFTGTVWPRYAVDGGSVLDVGSPLVLTGGLLAAVQGGPALAVGIISTSREAVPFTATWDLIEVTADPSTAEALVAIDPPGSGIDASTYNSGSFQITNNSASGQRIETVQFDMSTAIMPDMVFDPDGVAGDLVAKPFTPNAGASATGLVGHTLSGPHDDGYDVIDVQFNDFDPGETFTFAIDVDPTTIRGTSAPGPNESGSVSGLELTSTRITVTFDDGTTLIADTFPPAGSLDASLNTLRASPPLAPAIEVLGVPSSPAVVLDPQQTVRVTGPAGADVRILVLEGGLFTEGLPGGGFDVDPFEANSALGTAEYQATIGGTQTVDVPITVLESEPLGGINHIAAVIVEPDGRTGASSNVIVLELGEADVVATPDSVNFGGVEVGQSALTSVTLTNNGVVGVEITGLNLSGDVAFALSNPPGLPAALAAAGGNVSIDLQFSPTSAGSQDGTLTVEHTGSNSPVIVSLSGTGLADAGPVLYRINCGGPQLAAADGSQPDWSEDTNANPSPYRNSGSNAASTGSTVQLDPSVPAAAPMAMFQRERWDPADAPEMQWDFPIDPGVPVEVRLYFAETYSGITAANQRVFDVQIEGSTVLAGFDQFDQAGYLVGLMKSFVVTVGDGNLDIDLFHVVENPTINGIEILEAEVPPECVDDPDCDDTVACTEDRCEAGSCVHDAAALDGQTCDDGDACTENDTCSNGTCAGTGIDCDDSNPCTDDSCDPITGCVHTPNTDPCDDGVACTDQDTCSDGICAGVDGCPEGQFCDVGTDLCEYVDTDDDGVFDHDDDCPNTIPGATVGPNGCPSPPIPADFDYDGDVDQGDVTVFEACASGPDVPLEPGCEDKDFDSDNDIDQSDFGIVQRCISGENNPGDPNCAD